MSRFQLQMIMWCINKAEQALSTKGCDRTQHKDSRRLDKKSSFRKPREENDRSMLGRYVRYYHSRSRTILIVISIVIWHGIEGME